MRAAMITTLEGPSSVQVHEVASPVPDAGEVLIEVHAAGVAFPEVLQSRGLYQLKPDLPFIPGAEVAGIVRACPDGSGLEVGDRVAALPLLGGFAEQVCVRNDLVFPLPDSVSFEQGAAMIFNYGTAYFALLERGGLVAGESVLVHGAAGGIGTASIQVAKAFGASRVIAVTSTDEKGKVAVEAGADEYVLADGFKDAVARAGGVDIVVDPVGGDRFTDSLRCLKEDGRVLVIGFTAGEIPQVRVNRLLLNNISVVGVGWGAYVLPKPGHVAWEWEQMLPHLENGALAPVVGTSLPLEAVTDALHLIDTRRAQGKVVLNLRGKR
ncbi:MAG: NADPH:quinone oxidoreductase family protein [Actinomycetota bacterium]